MHDRLMFQTAEMADNGDSWVRVYRTFDGFYYSSRPGHNSVAFILVDHENKRIGLVECMHCPTDTRANRAFTGSMDVPPGISTTDVCIAEVKEEAGFNVTYKNLELLGTFEVSHQTDEVAYLYVVDVTGLEQGEPQPQDFREEDQKVVWTDDTGDWKAILLIEHVKNKWAKMFWPS